MKKSLLAAALLGTFAASAFAAPSVTLYGLIDTGISYLHQHDRASFGDLYDPPSVAFSVDDVRMKSGNTAESRWGLKGSEDIGSMKVGFTLESGFASDDGTTAGSGRLFGREAEVNVSGAYGTLYAGRFFSIVSDQGPVGYLKDVSAFPGVYTEVAEPSGSTGSAYRIYDNTLAYETPYFAGFQAAAMYSFKSDGTVKTGTENKADAERYAAAGIRYKSGKAAAVLAADYTMYANDGTAFGDVDNGYSVIAGGNYDFGTAKVFAKATYFHNQSQIEDTFWWANTVQSAFQTGYAYKGWGAELGVTVPAFGGTVSAAAGYRDAENVDRGNFKLKRLNGAVSYTYPFSKRTNVYALVGAIQEKVDGSMIGQGQSVNIDFKGTAFQGAFGIVHRF